MSIIELIDIIRAHGLIVGVIVAFISLKIIQISPIKLDPLTYIHKSVVNFLNGAVLEKISTIDNKITRMQEDLLETEKKMDKNEAVAARVRILRFNDEVLHNEKHTKAMFDQTLLDIDQYNEYCKKDSHFRNSVTTLAAENIRKVYKKCSEEHKFLD